MEKFQLNTSTVVNSGEIYAIKKRLYIHEPCTIGNAIHSFCIRAADLFVEYFALLFNFTLNLPSESCSDESATERDKPEILTLRTLVPVIKRIKLFFVKYSFNIYINSFIENQNKKMGLMRFF